MKTWCAIAVVVLLTGCRQEQVSSVPVVSHERRTLDASTIHREMPGTWTSIGQNGLHFCHELELDTNGDFFIAKDEEIPHWMGTWKLLESMVMVTNEFGQITMQTVTNGGSMLYLTYGKPSATNYNLHILPVAYIDEHELILRPDISAAGSYQFTR